MENVSSCVSELIDRKAKKRLNCVINAKDTVSVPGTYYYVSNTGNDNNDGLSIQSPWKTLCKVNETELNFGDAVLFERGGLWRGQIVCSPGVTYAAYGSGEKPKIYGSPENGSGKEKWILYNSQKRIWKYYKELLDVGCIVFNDGASYAYKEIPSFYDGSFVLRKNSNIPFSIDEHLTEELSFFSDCRKEVSENGSIAVHSVDNTGSLYLKCKAGNPGEVFDSIEFLTRPNIISVRNNSNISVDNLCLKYGGGMAVGGYYADNISVTNCEIGWIGGSIQFYKQDGSAVRYGNGVEIAASCDNYTVENNYIYQVYDAGISYQSSSNTAKNIINSNVRFVNNLIEYCIYGIEYFLGNCRMKNFRNCQKNILFDNNIIRYTGFGFGYQRPNKGLAAAIKTWKHENRSENFVISNNIFDRSRNHLFYIQAHNTEWLPVLKNNLGVQYEDTDAILGYYGCGDEIAEYTFSKSLSGIDNVLLYCRDKLGTEIYLVKKDDLYSTTEGIYYG